MKRARLLVYVLHAPGDCPCARRSKHPARGVRTSGLRSGDGECVVPIQIRERNRVWRAECVSCKNRSASSVNLHQFEMRVINDIESKRQCARSWNRADEFQRTATRSTVERKNIPVQ